VAEAAINSARAADLEAVVDALEAASFRLPFDDRADRERARTEMAFGIREFLLPRVTEPEAPVTGLLTGLTGTGKSTLLNSLAGRRLSPTSALRPTTTEPVIWAHRRHAGRYWQEFVSQVEERIGPSAEIIVDDEDLLDHLTLIDAPPLDGASGADLLSLADLSIFVTSATRYADSQTWDLLDMVRTRGLPVLFVINRVPRDAASSQAVTDDLASKLAEAGFLPRPDPALLFVVFEHRIDVSTDGLPGGSVTSLRKELSELGDPAFRSKLVTTAQGALFDDLGGKAGAVAGFARNEAAAGRELLAAAERAYNARIAAIGTDLEHGKYADVATDWDPERLARSLTRHIAVGAQETAAAWSEDPIGRRLTQGAGQTLWRGSEGAMARVLAALDEWGSALESLAADRSKRGRLLRPTRRRLGVLLRKSALGGAGVQIPPQLIKRYGDQGAIAVVRAARGALLEALGPAFQADASRFRSAVGPLERLEVLAAVIDDKSTAFRR